MFGTRARFVLFMLIAAALPAVTAMIVSLHYASAAHVGLEHRLAQTSTALKAQVDAESARRSELLIKLSLYEPIVGPVREAAAQAHAAPAAAVTQLHNAIAEQVKQNQPTLFAVATSQGAQVIIGNTEPVAVDIKDLQGAGAALNGNSVQVFSLFKDSLYRLTAMPIGVGEAAIVIGDKIGETTAKRWREVVQADVTLVSGAKVLVSTAKPESRTAIAAAAKRPSITTPTGRAGLGWPQLGFLDRFFPIGFPGAGELSVASDVGGVVAIVTVPSDLAWVGGVQALGFLACLVILMVGLIWMQLVYGPIYRQARSIEAHLARLKVERNARLTTKGFSAPFLHVVEHLDKLVEFWNARESQLQQAQPPRETPPAPAPTTTDTPRAIPRPQVALPLAETPASEPESIDHDEFPFGENRTTGKTERVPKTEEPAEEPSATPSATPRLVRPSPSTPAAKSTPAPAPSAKSTPAPARVTPSAKPAPVASTAKDTGPVVPLPGANRPTAQRGPALAAAAATDDDDLPPELLARSQELEEELLAPAEDPDEEHYQAVFEEFVTVRRRCGEPADGLTFEKFKARLQKNREQLMDKFSCKTVRFQVYVKDGKAAVKALPVH